MSVGMVTIEVGILRLLERVRANNPVQVAESRVAMA
jgi:hypothetical protein